MGSRKRFSFQVFASVTFIFFLCGIYLAFSQAEETKSPPDWLKRIEFSAQWETDKKPTVYFETIQPFYQSPDKINTFFYQPRVSLRSGDLIYNFGVGYRRLASEDLLLGLNVFGDYADRHEHGRVGCGFEALGQTLEARINGYFGVTSKRVVEEQDTVSTTYERVADGLDGELGSPIPYLPWLKLYGSGFWYDFKKSSDKIGWKGRLEATLNKALILEFYTWDDNKGRQEFGGRARCRLNFDRFADFKEIFKLASVAFPKKDLKESTLVPVERNFDIVVEKWIEAPNGTVQVVIGRAN
jgi:hypothetical protein